MILEFLNHLYNLFTNWSREINVALKIITENYLINMKFNNTSWIQKYKHTCIDYTSNVVNKHPLLLNNLNCK